jgi:probable rRNA maturation factor
VRSTVLAAASVPEVAARLPEGRLEVAVRLTGDRELRRLNRGFLGSDEPTDVLAFPAGPAPAGGQETAGHLGDIALSVPTARRQAEEFGHPLETEVALLCVHGFLHLLGWDHATARETAEMNRLTLVALESRGVSPAGGRLA